MKNIGDKILILDFGSQYTQLIARRGRILNIASIAAFPPGPFLAAYYGTKGYLLRWSEASPMNWRRAA